MRQREHQKIIRTVIAPFFAPFQDLSSSKVRREELPGNKSVSEVHLSRTIGLVVGILCIFPNGENNVVGFASGNAGKQQLFELSRKIDIPLNGKIQFRIRASSPFYAGREVTSSAITDAADKHKIWIQAGKSEESFVVQACLQKINLPGWKLVKIAVTVQESNDNEENVTLQQRNKYPLLTSFSKDLGIRD